MANFHDPYRAYFENANEAIFLIHRGQFIDCNPKAEELFGCSREEILSGTPDRFSPKRQPDGEKSREKATRKIQEVLRGEPQVFEWEHLRSNGDPFMAEVRLSRVEIKGIPRVLALVHDISDRKRDKQELEYSREKYRTLVDNAQTGVFLIRSHRIEFANEAFNRIIGYEMDELLGKDFRELILPDDLEQLPEDFPEGSADGKETGEFDLHIRHKDGSVRLVHVRAGGISYLDETATMGTVMDVTQLRRSEKLQHAIYQISESAHAAENLQDLYSRIHNILQELMPAENMYIALYDPKTSTVSFPYHSDRHEPPPPPRRDGNGLTEYILQTDRPFLVSEGNLEEVRMQGFAERGSPAIDWLGVPLKSGRDTIGVLTVQNYDHGVKYGEREKEILSFVSDQIAMAISRKQADEELRTLSNAVEKAADDIVITDAEGRIEYVNPSFQQLTGYHRDEVVGESIDILRSGDDPNSRRVTEIEEELGRIGMYQGEFRHQKKSGEQFYHDLVITPVQSEKGEIAHYIYTGRDVTERKKIERVRNALLKISEAAHETQSLDELYQTIHAVVQEFMPAGNFYIAMYDSENQQVTMPYFVDEYDEAPVGPQEAGNGLTEYVATTGKPVLGSEDDIKRMAEEGEIEIKGSLPVDWLGVPLKTEDKIVGVLAVQSYTTGVRYSEREKEILTFVSNQIAMTIARKQAESMLAAERERLAVTLRSIGDGVITTDRDGKILLMNRMAEKLTGWTQAGAMGQPLSAVCRRVDEKTGESIPVPLEKVLHTGSLPQAPSEVVWLDHEGQRRIMSETIAPLRDDESQTIGAIMVFSDITDQRELEREVFKARKLESVGVLAGGIAHDFNNILSGILGNISLAKLTLDQPDKLEELLSEAEGGSRRAAKLTKQLLTFSKGGTPVKETAEMGELIQESVEFALRGSNVRPKIVIDKGLWWAEVDTGQIDQVLQNLVINADQAMPEGGTILIRASNVPPEDALGVPGLKEERHICIRVQDSGSGIPASNIEKIFDPYFSTKKNGNGLGLATSYSIIQKHDGTITVDSRVGSGTTMAIYLPAISVEKAGQSSFSQARPAYSWNGSHKILLMDDEEPVKLMASTMLERLGFEVHTADCGREAVKLYRNALAEEDPFNLVILDLTIPGGVGGKEAISELKAHHPGVKAIVSSGYSTDPIMSDFRSYGFAGKIEKPYNVDEMISTLQQVIGAEEMTQSEV